MTSISRNSVLLAATLALALASCSDNDDETLAPPIAQTPYAALNNIDTSGGVDGIVDLPATAPGVVSDVFARYSQITMPNGRIHFLAQSGVSDEVHVRARRILLQHLTDVPGSAFGADKAAVRAAIVAAEGVFTIYRDAASADIGLAEVAAFALEFPEQATLLATDSVVEGSVEYMALSPAIDGTFASTARFVVRAGSTALAPFTAALAARAADAVSGGAYVAAPAATDVDGEFLGRTLEAWYGIWGHDPRNDGLAGVDDTYAFVTRTGMENGDPQTVALLAGFFPSFHSYPAYLTDGFTGTFDSAFDVALPYTHRSQYLTRVGLRGTTGARLAGNALDGVYAGGFGDDEFEGRGGNDLIEGGSSTDFDRAFYSGPSTEYQISPSPSGGGAWQVRDLVPNRDGIDQVRFIEELVFTDMTVQL